MNTIRKLVYRARNLKCDILITQRLFELDDIHFVYNIKREEVRTGRMLNDHYDSYSFTQLDSCLNHINMTAKKMSKLDRVVENQ